jgi:hypothetical protein
MKLLLINRSNDPTAEVNSVQEPADHNINRHFFEVAVWKFDCLVDGRTDLPFLWQISTITLRHQLLLV